jgi:hypothetical protein
MASPDPKESPAMPKNPIVLRARMFRSERSSAPTWVERSFPSTAAADRFLDANEDLILEIVWAA